MLIGVPAPEAVINLINLFDEFEINPSFRVRLSLGNE